MGLLESFIFTSLYSYFFSYNSKEMLMPVRIEDIREYFIMRQKERNPFYKLMPKYDKVDIWQKISEKCQKLDVTEKFYVDFVFDTWGKRGITIFPATLINSKIERKIQQYQETVGKQTQISAEQYVDQEYKKAVEIIRNFLKSHPGGSHITVLRLGGFQIPAWLRLSLSPEDDIVRSKYLDDAKKDLANIKGLATAIAEKKGLLDFSWI